MHIDIFTHNSFQKLDIPSNKCDFLIEGLLIVVNYGGIFSEFFITLKEDSERLFPGLPIIEVQEVTCIR